MLIQRVILLLPGKNTGNRRKSAQEKTHLTKVRRVTIMKNKQNKHLYILPINKKVTVVYVVFFNLINLSEVALMGRIKKTHPNRNSIRVGPIMKNKQNKQYKDI